ncbi:MAG: hypothetical protein IKS31_05505 [Clostridia bacterium]|nr:hypothetical protein [Clostridia bacterium]
MSWHSDPTADRAIGNLTREWKRMTALAVRIRENPDTDWAERQSRLFVGIYSRLLTDPIETLKGRSGE